MRRKLNNNSIILIVVIALFTLLSYSFDQLVIRNEDKLRNLQIKLENLNTEIETYNSVDLQLITLSDLILTEYSNLRRSNKYWLKAILINTDHEKSNILLENNIKKFSENTNLDLPYQRYVEHFYSVIVFFNDEIRNKYADIHWWNKKIFTGEVFEISYIDVFDEIKKDLKNKDLNFYVDLVNTDSMDEVLKKAQLSDWHDIYIFSHAIIKNLTKYYGYIEMDLKRIETYLERSETLRINTIEEISKVSTFKNYFILSSIISQILSLLFLLILFRILIKL